MFDELGPWFTLLRLGSDAPEVEAWAEAADNLNIPLAIVAIAEQGIFDLYETSLALIRPDQHVAWRGESVGDPESILNTVIAAKMRDRQ